MTPLAALALCRFAGDAAALGLWGGCAYIAWLVPGSLAAALAARLRGWGVAAALLLAGATAAALPATAGMVGEGWRGALDPALVGAVLAGTGAGRAWAVQAAAAALLAALCLAPGRLRPAAAAGAAALWLLGLALTGHASTDEGWRGAAHRALDAAHVLSAGAWLGALGPVLLILPRLACAADRPAAALALRRFSRAGHAAVALALLTGAGNAALVLGRWPLDLGSPYEALLDAKVLAVAVLAGLAVLNRYLLVPRLPASLPLLRRATLAELPLGLLAVALVAAFGLLDPG